MIFELPPPTPPTPEEQRAALAHELMDVMASFQPIFDTAGGMRADLERRGWSPAMAEHLAGVWLAGTLATITRGSA
ncbi:MULTISPECIES: hypothetical protein [unclassified Streptomyces]|uniref:hypothetical protein n=1 Tax=unclassified Streptomyces TaxID=2593676 RepID=UPI003401C79C